MKVNGTSTHIVAKPALEVPVKPQSTPTASQNAIANTDRTTAIEAVIGDAQQALTALPNVDMEKVTAMKALVDAGAFSVDLEELTQTMLRYHQKG